MRHSLVFQPDPTVPEEHPAFHAWRALHPRGRAPAEIEVVTRRKGKPTVNSSVYRLHGVGRHGTPVIAKRSGRETVRVERRVYEEILPGLPLPALRCYGYVEDREDGDRGWLFLEDAGGARYVEDNPEHRALASAWLGVLHASTARRDLSSLLRVHRPEPYLLRLHAARKTVGENLSHPELDRAAVAVLERIVVQCGIVESLWPEIERFWDTLPRCLVHGDFISKNVRVRETERGPALYVLDWEAAGWGAPVPDAGGLDSPVYWSHVRETWPHLDLRTVEQLILMGTLLRYVAWIAATSPGLADEWRERTLLRLTEYEGRLAQALRTAGWAR
jgi:hypothetical protein